MDGMDGMDGYDFCFLLLLLLYFPFSCYFSRMGYPEKRAAFSYL